MARDAAKGPEECFDLGQVDAKGVTVEICGTCKVRCGLYQNEPYFDGAQETASAGLAEWVSQA